MVPQYRVMPDGSDPNVAPTQTSQTPAAVPEAGSAPAPPTAGEPDWKALATRYGDQVKGYAPLHQAMTGLGIRTREDIEALAPLMQGMKARGMTPGQLASLIAAQDQSAVGGAGEPHTDIASLIDSKLGEFRREQAIAAHQAALEQEDQAIAAAVAEALGDKPTPQQKTLLEALARSTYQTERSTRAYPQGHPLHDDVFGPAGADGLAKVKSALSEHAGYLRGQAAADIARAAAQTNHAPPTAAGGRGGHGPVADDRDQGPDEFIRSVVAKHATLGA